MAYFLHFPWIPISVTFSRASILLWKTGCCKNVSTPASAESFCSLRISHFSASSCFICCCRNIPWSIIDRNLPRLDTSYVIGDNKTGGALCLRHLHALGHQRICFVSSARRNTFTVRSRIDGILQEAEARNIPESSITIWDFFNKHQPYVHYQKQMMKLIREERITAFIAAESTTCAYLYSLFATMNLRVPEDISLMSFDKPLVESQRPDFFTHISQSEYLMGKEAGTILKHQIETRDPQVTHRVMSPLLEVRKSTRAIVL